jgi:hypothetical protein
MNIFLDQVHEIEVHKYIESQKAGHDVGEAWAAIDWVTKHAEKYREAIEKKERRDAIARIRELRH